MSQQQIVPVVEGDGELHAVPVLLRRLLFETKQRYEFSIARPRVAKGRDEFEKNFEYFMRLAAREPNSRGILVLLDSDDDCPKQLAFDLAKRAYALNFTVPIVIVCATREYEAWFLASLESIAGKSIKGRDALPAGLRYEGDVETRRGAKEWLDKRMPANRGYLPTEDQAPMTELIDFELARKNSRSFRRLEHALEELLAAIDNQQATVTPFPQE